MKYGRITIILAALTLCGAYLGVMAQERREPWPPRPVVPPDSEEQQEPPRPRGLDLPPAKAPEKLDIGLPPPVPPPTVTDDLPPPVPPPSVPVDPPGIKPAGDRPKETKGMETPIVIPKIDDAPPPPKKDHEYPPPRAVGSFELPVPKDAVKEVPKDAVREVPKDAVRDIPKAALFPAAAAPPVEKSDEPPAFRILHPGHKSGPSIVVAPPPRAPVEAQTTSFAPIAANNSAVTVEKRGPAHVKHTDPIAYTITIRNTSSSAVQEVRIEDEMPAQTRLLQADPEPAFLGNRMVWHVPTLAAGEEKVIRLVLQASQVGELASSARLFLPVGQSETRTMVHPGAAPVAIESALQVQVRVPPTAARGKQVVFEVTVQNGGKKALGAVLVLAKMSDGLEHSEGPEVDVTLSGLAPGGKETLKLPLIASKNGSQYLDVVVKSVDGQRAAARGTVMVGDSTLKVQMKESHDLLVQGEGEIVIEMVNPQATGERNLVVVETLPEGVEFVAASDQGLYRDETRTVQWLVDLAPGQKKSLLLKVAGKKAGEFSTQVVARPKGKEEIRAASKVHVEGRAALAVEMKQRDQALEVGKDTVCEIQVHNKGTGPATGIELAAAIPDGMAAQKAQGPTPFRVEGRKLVFEPVRALSPGEKAQYLVSMTAQAPGNQRFQVQVASDQGTTPITREERVLVYRDN